MHHPGLVSKVSHIQHDCLHIFLTRSHRCDAPAQNLDGGNEGRRAHKLTEALFDVLDAGPLWNDYGIVDNIFVCSTTLGFCL